jgi:hypothetical protein
MHSRRPDPEKGRPAQRFARAHLSWNRRKIPREKAAVTETRIKPYQQQLAENARRTRQRQIYRRNQVIGIIILAAAILVLWLFRTNPKWIFPTGWWRS